jgi:hypothetical protein
MKKYPFIFIAIGLIHLLEPLVKIYFLHQHSGFPYTVVIGNALFSENFQNFFEFWLLSPLMGFAVLWVESWTYYLFLVLQVYSIYLFSHFVPYSPPFLTKTPHPFATFTFIVDCLTFFYFLFPANRRPYLDRRSRWWRVSRRYNFESQCTLGPIKKSKKENAAGPIQIEGRILNIGERGAFIKLDTALPLNSKVLLTLPLKEEKISFPVRIVNEHTWRGQFGNGVLFLFPNHQTKKIIRNTIEDFKNQELNLP